MKPYTIIRSAPKYDVLTPPAKGVIVRDYRAGYRGARYQFFAWDKKVGKYVGARFDALKDGEEWALNESASFRMNKKRAGRSTLAELLPAYLKHLADNKTALRYVERVKSTLNAAIAFGVTNLKTETAGEKAAEMLRGWDSERSISTHTLHYYQLTFRNFGGWAVQYDEDTFATNPFRNVPLVKLPELKMPVFTPGEMIMMIEKCWDHPSQRLREEARFFITKAYTGMRLRELAWTRRSQWLWDAKRIRVTLADEKDKAVYKGLFLDGREGPMPRADYLDGMRKKVKGNKERSALFMDELMDLWRPHFGIGDEYVFPERFRMASSSVYGRMLASVCEAAGITRGTRHAHHFRSTFAATFLAGDGDSILLKRYMGHSKKSNGMTEHYADAADDLREECKGWGGQIRWRRLAEQRKAAVQLSNGCPVAPVRQGQPDTGLVLSNGQADADASEDEQEVIVIVPDTSALYREILLRPTGTDGAGAEIQHVVSTARPSVVEMRGKDKAAQEDTTIDDIGCPS